MKKLEKGLEFLGSLVYWPSVHDNNKTPTDQEKHAYTLGMNQSGIEGRWVGWSVNYIMWLSRIIVGIEQTPKTEDKRKRNVIESRRKNSGNGIGFDWTGVVIMMGEGYLGWDCMGWGVMDDVGVWEGIGDVNENVIIMHHNSHRHKHKHGIKGMHWI